MMLSLTSLRFAGVHPWFIHSLSLANSPTPPSKEAHYATLFPSANDVSQPHPALAELLPTLPTPLLLSDFLATLSDNLSSHSTSLLGEVGLDKAFRLPNPPSLASSSKNSDLQTPLAHQIAVVEAQVEVAIKLLRHVSFHSVRAPQDTVQLLERLSWKEGFGRIHTCLHSFGGSPDTAVQIQKGENGKLCPLSTALTTPPHAPQLTGTFSSPSPPSSRRVHPASMTCCALSSPTACLLSLTSVTRRSWTSRCAISVGLALLSAGPLTVL